MKSLDSIEFKHYSQNGEDGIIEFLVSHLPEKNKTFVEIGCGTGNENNTTNLVHNGWSGVVFDRKQARIDRYHTLGFNEVSAHFLDVSPANVDQVLKLIPSEPNVFSLDIDGYDYHVMKALLENGFRPDIAVLEYNKAFCHLPLTVKYPMIKGLDRSLYFGCGLEAWKKLMLVFNYNFVTTDSTGTNAFFAKGIAPEYLQGVVWQEISSPSLDDVLYLHFDTV